VRAVVIAEGELRFEERPDPVPADTEVLVAVRAAGLNNADLLQRLGFYPPPPGWPEDIPGMEFAGEVVGTGRQVTRFSIGDRVMAVVGGGAQATLAVVDEFHALPVPDGVDWPEAGGFPEAFFTAFDALWYRAQLAMGDRVLVTGAAGGVGCAGVQLAAAAGGVVVAAVRDPARHDAVRGLGAQVVIDPTEVAAHGPYDVVLELVGAESLPTALGALATEGRIVVIGVGSGAQIQLNLLELMGKRGHISAATMRARSRIEKAVVTLGLEAHVLPLLASRRVRVPITETVPMADVEKAYARFAEGGKLGKVVLVN
jgi:NADPH2:quinone reductase